MRNFVEYPRNFQNLLNFWDSRTFCISQEDFNNGYEYLISLFKQAVDTDKTISDKEMVKFVWQTVLNNLKSDEERNIEQNIYDGNYYKKSTYISLPEKFRRTTILNGQLQSVLGIANSMAQYFKTHI